MPGRHDITLSTIGGTPIGFMLTRDRNGHRSYSVVDAQTIAPRFLTEEQISQQQLPPDLALTFPQTSWHRGIGGIIYKASDPDVLADGTRIDVTERGVIKLAREIVASTVDSNPDEFVSSGFAISGTQSWAFIGRDVYSWDFTNKNWDIGTEPVAAARIFRTGVNFDGRIYVPSWADDIGSGGSYVSADEPVNYLHKLISDAGWTLIANSGQTLEGPKYMAVADQKLWGGNFTSAADSTLNIDGPQFDAATSGKVDNGGVDTSTTLSFAHVTANRSNRILVVSVASIRIAGAAYPTGVTYNGVALTALASARTTSGTRSISMWYLVAPATGSNTLTATFASTHAEIVMGATSLIGVAQTGTISDEGAATGTSTTPSVTLNATADDEWAIDGLTSQLDSTPTVGAGQTSRWTQATANLQGNAGSTEEATGASVTMSWTIDNSLWLIAAVALTPIAIIAGTTAIPTSGTASSQFAAGDVIKVDSEYMLLTAVSDSPSEITVVRGYRGSAAATHANDADIYELTENVHHVRSTTNGSAYANWSTATTIGDSGSAITGLVGVGTQLVVIKTDGIYTLEEDGTVTNRLPGGIQMGHANFGKGAWAWNNLVFIPLHGGGLWELETETWTIRDISFVNSMPDQTQYHGRVVAGSGEPGRLYVVVQETATTSYHIFQTQNPAQVGLSDYNWTQIGSIAYTTGTDPDHAAALLTAVTNGTQEHHRLLVGIESTGSNLLPRYITHDSHDVDDEYTATDAEAYSVFFDAGFPNILKRAQNVVLNTDNLGATGGTNHLIHVRYRLEGTGDWLYVNSGTTTNTGNNSTVTGDNQTIAFSAGVTFRKIELRFTLDRRTTANQTTPELHDFTMTTQLRTTSLKLLPLSLYLANGLRLLNGMTENRALANRNQLRTWNASGAEVVLVDAEGGTRNVLFLPGHLKETELSKLDRRWPEYQADFIVAEVG